AICPIAATTTHDDRPCLLTVVPRHRCLPSLDDVAPSRSTAAASFSPSASTAVDPNPRSATSRSHLISHFHPVTTDLDDAIFYLISQQRPSALLACPPPATAPHEAAPNRAASAASQPLGVQGFIGILAATLHAHNDVTDRCHDNSTE
ncbi:hypothetical protein BHM03_00036890, partial [Ensete ventricosum]